MGQPLRKAEPETRSYRERIRELVEADRVEGARRLLAEALERGDHGEDLSRWERVLAKTKGRRNPEVALDFDRTPEITWIREKSDPYKGQWVALLGDQLLAHSASLDEVMAVLEANKPPRRPMVHYID
ncbi:MAG: hypothetical protein JF614_12315 [Acidobacteria bacterium]|nr:hypothetical protein [Acidobacteriota bacterium]